MKLIIDNEYPDEDKLRVEISSSGEDMDSLFQLFRQGALAMGFQPETVNEWMPDEER